MRFPKSVIFVVVLTFGLTVAHASNPAVSRLYRVISDVEWISSSLKDYKREHGAYPETDEGLIALLLSAQLTKLPQDPWGRDYQYSRIGEGFKVWSFGEDGLEGGDGFNFDYSNQDPELNQKNLKAARSEAWASSALFITLALFIVFLVTYLIIRKIIGGKIGKLI